jgi:mRNA interferase MazF
VGEVLSENMNLACPYCSSSDILCIAASAEDMAEDMDMGCLGIYFSRYDDGNLMLYTEREFATAMTRSLESGGGNGIPLGSVREIITDYCTQRDAKSMRHELSHIKNGGAAHINRKIRRGDMYYADLTHGVGSEQSGNRPVLIIQNNAGNKHSNTVIAAVITSQMGKAKLPTHCLIKKQQGLGRDSLVLLEQIRTIDKERLKEYIGTLDNEAMSKIDKALAVSVGLK